MLWLSAGVICLPGAGLMKAWFRMELNKNGAMRETRRVELQIARLSERVKTADLNSIDN